MKTQTNESSPLAEINTETLADVSGGWGGFGRAVAMVRAAEYAAYGYPPPPVFYYGGPRFRYWRR